MRIYMSSVFLTVFSLFLFITLMILLTSLNLLHINMALGLLVVTTLMVVSLLVSVLISESRSKKITREIASKCTYNPFARAIEIHMNDEAREQISEKVDLGEYPGHALNDRVLLRKHYLNGIRTKILKCFMGGYKVVIVAHSLSELNLLRAIPGSKVLAAGAFTKLAHNMGIRTYTIPKHCPKIWVPVMKLMAMTSNKYPVFWTEIEPSEEAIHWLNQEYDVENFVSS